MSVRKKIVCLFFIVFVGTIITKISLFNNSIMNYKIESLNYTEKNEITTLDTPTELKWKEGSTATATWKEVENANYYNIVLYLYNNEDELVNTIETGTSLNSLDVQQEINYMIDEKNLSSKSFKVSFKATAMYIFDNESIMSIESDESSKKYFEVGTGIVKLNSPENITIDDDYNATWSASEGADHYWLTFSMNGIEQSLYGQIVFSYYASNYSYGSETNGVFKANIKKAISDFYANMVKSNKITAGQTVELKFKVEALPSSTTNSNYIQSDQSVYSNTFNYSDSTIIKIATPNNISIDDDYNATWSASEGADHYWLTFSMNGIEQSLYGQIVFSYYASNYSYGSETNGVFKANIKKAISDFYANMVKSNKITAGQTVELKFKVEALPSSTTNSNYIQSDQSVYSNTFNYSDSTIIKIATPNNISIDDDYNATWSASEGADHYWLTFSMNGIEQSLYGQIVFSYYASNYSYGSETNGVFKANIKKAISDFYANMVKSNKITAGQTVELKFKVEALPSSTTNSNYIQSDQSVYSNIFYYNSDGSTKINNIILSPNKPVIAIGRSIYIGKTIEPASALYDSIKWTTSDKNIVNVSNTGKITGVRKGTATITAQINNATQNAEVSVYEIDSNIEDESEASNVINEANDVIEAIISNEDVSNIDITNKDDVINEIENGAQNGNKFKVDINFDEKSTSDYSNIRKSINDRFNDMSIGGGYDIKIELYHKDSKNIKHHIANITELENNVNFELEIPSSLPKLESTKTREYKLVRIHNDNLEEIEATFNEDGTFSSSSNKFSDFILLYKDADIPVTKLSIDKTSITLLAGKDSKLPFTFTPLDTLNDKTLTWSSSDENVVTVDDSGKITAVNSGNAVITVTTTDGISDTCNVKVVNQLKGDFSKNGEVKLDDAIIGLRKVFGYISSDDNDLAVGDLNNNGKLDLSDIIILLRYIFGYIKNI